MASEAQKETARAFAKTANSYDFRGIRGYGEMAYFQATIRPILLLLAIPAADLPFFENAGTPTPGAVQTMRVRNPNKWGSSFPSPLQPRNRNHLNATDYANYAVVQYDAWIKLAQRIFPLAV